MSAYDELMQKQAAFMQTPGYMEKQADAKQKLVGTGLREGAEWLGKYTGGNPMRAIDDLASSLKGAVSGKGAGAARAAAKSVDDIAGSALSGADDVVGAVAKDAVDDVAAAAAKKVVPTTPTPATPAVPPAVPPPIPPAEAAEAAAAEVAKDIAAKPGFWGGMKNRTSELWGKTKDKTSELWGKAKNKGSEAWNRAVNGTREYAMAHPLRAAGIAAAGSAGAGALGGAGIAAMMDEDPNQALMRAYMQQRMNPYLMMMRRPMMNPMMNPMLMQRMNPMMGQMAGINPALLSGAAAASGSPLLSLLGQLQNRAMSYAPSGSRGFHNGGSSPQSDLRDKLVSLAKFTPMGMSTGWWLR